MAAINARVLAWFEDSISYTVLETQGRELQCECYVDESAVMFEFEAPDGDGFPGLYLWEGEFRHTVTHYPEGQATEWATYGKWSPYQITLPPDPDPGCATCFGSVPLGVEECDACKRNREHPEFGANELMLEVVICYDLG